MNRIDSFSGNYAYLSNFYRVPVVFEGVIYPSTENAYQAAKTTNLELREPFQTYTSGKAKQEGSRLKLRPGWDTGLKLKVMEEVCWYKFYNDLICRANLLATKGIELIEGNSHGDRYWGVCNGVGDNNLGKILMRIRMQLETGEYLVDY